MMKNINVLLPKAMDALKSSDLLKKEGTAIPKEYDGYVASFAPSIITAGLKATLSFYTDKHKSAPKRVKVLTVIQTIYQTLPTKLDDKDLLDLALGLNANDERQLRKDLIDCAIALKLVMRNFEQIDTDKQNQDRP